MHTENRSLTNSFSRIIFGILLIPISIYLIYYGEYKLINYSDFIKHTKNFQDGKQGDLVRLTGKPKSVIVSNNKKKNSDLHKKHSFLVLKKTHSKFIEKTYKTKSKVKKTKRRWEKNLKKSTRDYASSFILNNLTINISSNAKFKSIEYDYTPKPVYKKINPNSTTTEVGDEKTEIVGLTDNVTITVYGKKEKHSISEFKDEILIITTNDHSGLMKSLKTEETTKYWLFKILSFLAMAIGLTLIVDPIIVIFGYIPGFGKSLNSIIKNIAFIIALFIVTFLSLLVKYFWIAIGLFVITVILLSMLKSKSSK